jgi:hypothetical protein
MNSLKASFAGGVLHSTDYFSSRDHDEGRAWLVLCGTDWHVLLPRLPPSRLTVAHARPVTDCHELDGWRWRLELGGWHLPLPRRQILSQRPLLPQPYTCSERTLTLYTGELKAASGQSFFGSVQLGVQIHCTCRLWLVRDTRRGEKAHEQQRRLKRFREQQLGGR